MNNKKGFSAIEVAATIVIILLVLVSFRGYIQRGFAGRWKAVGDVFGQTKQYDPRGFGTVGEKDGTLDCFWDEATGVWVDEDCYQKTCDCTLLKIDGVTPLSDYAEKCTACKTGKCRGDARCE